MSDNYFQNTGICEICYANTMPEYFGPTMDIYSIEDKFIHCQELRRNRESRKNKNIKPKSTVF